MARPGTYFVFVFIAGSLTLLACIPSQHEEDIPSEESVTHLSQQGTKSSRIQVPSRASKESIVSQQINSSNQSGETQREDKFVARDKVATGEPRLQLPKLKTPLPIPIQTSTKIHNQGANAHGSGGGTTGQKLTKFEKSLKAMLDASKPSNAQKPEAHEPCRKDKPVTASKESIVSQQNNSSNQSGERQGKDKFVAREKAATEPRQLPKLKIPISLPIPTQISTKIHNQGVNAHESEKTQAVNVDRAEKNRRVRVQQVPSEIETGEPSFQTPSENETPRDNPLSKVTSKNKQTENSSVPKQKAAGLPTKAEPKFNEVDSEIPQPSNRKTVRLSFSGEVVSPIDDVKPEDQKHTATQHTLRKDFSWYKKPVQAQKSKKSYRTEEIASKSEDGQSSSQVPAENRVAFSAKTVLPDSDEDETTKKSLAFEKNDVKEHTKKQPDLTNEGDVASKSPTKKQVRFVLDGVEFKPGYGSDGDNDDRKEKNNKPKHKRRRRRSVERYSKSLLRPQNQDEDAQRPEEKPESTRPPKPITLAVEDEPQNPDAHETDLMIQQNAGVSSDSSHQPSGVEAQETMPGSYPDEPKDDEYSRRQLQPSIVDQNEDLMDSREESSSIRHRPDDQNDRRERDEESGTDGRIQIKDKEENSDIETRRKKKRRSRRSHQDPGREKDDESYGENRRRRRSSHRHSRRGDEESGDERRRRSSGGRRERDEESGGERRRRNSSNKKRRKRYEHNNEQTDNEAFPAAAPTCCML